MLLKKNILQMRLFHGYNGIMQTKVASNSFGIIRFIPIIRPVETMGVLKRLSCLLNPNRKVMISKNFMALKKN